MRKSTLLSLVLIVLFAACTRSVGPITPAVPTQEPTQQPQPQITLSPPPSNTPQPSAEPKPSATPPPTQAEATAPPPATVAPTQEPTQAPPTDAPTSTPVNTPTATLPPFDPGASLGAPKFTDPMSDSSFRNWSRDNQMADTENIRLELDDGELLVTGKKLFFDTWWFSWPDPTDFYLEMKVETDACSGRDTYGVIFRGPPRDFGDTFGYQAVFTCGGEYQLRRVDSADPYTMVALTEWTQSANIKSGSNQANVLGVMADGDTISLYANGLKIAEVRDNEYTRGRYGVFVSAANTQNFTYRVDELTYWELP